MDGRRCAGALDEPAANQVRLAAEALDLVIPEWKRLNQRYHLYYPSRRHPLAR